MSRLKATSTTNKVKIGNWAESHLNSWNKTRTIFSFKERAVPSSNEISEVDCSIPLYASRMYKSMPGANILWKQFVSYKLILNKMWITSLSIITHITQWQINGTWKWKTQCTIDGYGWNHNLQQNWYRLGIGLV